VIFYVSNSRLSRTIRATIKRLFCLDAVPDDFAAAMIANGREFMDCTLETVERVTRSGRHNFKRKVIIVAAHFTLSHARSPRLAQIYRRGSFFKNLCNLWLSYDFLLRA
jgi:hypothetical protein